jgi:SAM-dependent methyltransferase
MRVAHQAPAMRRARQRALRWDVTEAELEQAYAVQHTWTPLALARTLARSPRLIPEAVRLGLRAAVKGVWSDVELGVILDSERVRHALPDLMRGAVWSPLDAYLHALLPLLDTDARVLEIGCGTGRIARHVAPRVRELVCSDISRFMLREARRNLAELPNVRFAQTRGYWLSGLPDAAFDVVYAHGVFGFFDLLPTLAMLDETRRVLGEGGTSIISFFTMDWPAWVADELDIVRGSATRGSFGARAAKPFTEGQIRALHQAVGLEVVDCGYERRESATNGGSPDLRLALVVVAKATRPRPPSRSNGATSGVSVAP